MNNPISTSQLFNQPITKVWIAITDVHEMTQWFFENIEDFKPEVGFYTEFNVKSEDRNFLHQWKIIEVIPNQKIVYDWRYQEYKGLSNVHFELFQKDEQTMLTVTHYEIEPFTDDIPEFKPGSCQAGWEYFINNRLKSYLES